MHHYPLTFGPRLRTTSNTTSLQSTPFFSPLHPPLIDAASAAAAAAAAAAATGLHSTYLQQGLMYPGMFTALPKPGLFNTSSISPLASHHHTTYKLNSFSAATRHKEDEVTSSEEATLINSRLDDARDTKSPKNVIELPIINENLRRPIDISCLTLFPAENIYESAAKLLFLAIKWARTIPSFLQLSHRDQSILLEESWSELFILTAAQWSLPIDENILVCNVIAPSTKQSTLEEDARKLREIINRLTLLRVDHTEHACLKALVLFKSECRGLCDATHVELLQDQTHVMLSEYCGSQRHSAKGRFGKLLLALPAVQSISRRSLEELLFRQTVGDVAIDRLLGDLAKVAHN